MQIYTHTYHTCTHITHMCTSRTKTYPPTSHKCISHSRPIRQAYVHHIQICHTHMHTIKCALKFIHLYTLYKHTSTHTDTSHTTIQRKRTHKPHMQICIYTHHKHIHPVHKYILHTHTTYPYGTHKYINTTHIPHMNTTRKRKPHIHS